MSAHPCPCGHPTMSHGAVGCNVHDGSTRTGACDCVQTFKDLTAGKAKPLFPGEKVVTSELFDLDGMTRTGRLSGLKFEAVGEGPVCVSPGEVVADIKNRAAAADTQVGGDHYLKHCIQPWDIWEDYGLNAFEGAVLKYLLRRKGDRVEDLKKARHTLDRLIEIEEAKESDGLLRKEAAEAE